MGNHSFANPALKQIFVLPNVGMPCNGFFLFPLILEVLIAWEIERSRASLKNTKGSLFLSQVNISKRTNLN